MKKGIYFGRFQPTHIGHLDRVAHIIEIYKPEEGLLMGVADWRGEPNRSNFLSGEEARMVAQMSLEDYGFQNTAAVSVPLHPDRLLEESILQSLSDLESVDTVFSGSDKTLTAVTNLRDMGLEVDIVDLGDDGRGVRATHIRQMIVDGNPQWHDYVTSRTADFLADPMLNLRERLLLLGEGNKRPWNIDGELETTRRGRERE